MTQPSETLLRFSKGGNAKLNKDIWSFSLPAGWSCPGAKECMTKVNPETGKLIDGAMQRFRCFAAVNETRPNVREQRWHNFELLNQAKTREGMTKLIIDSFPQRVKTMRIHVSGDFFNQAYFEAWCNAARHFSATEFYAYTKSLKQVEPYIKAYGLPKNLKLTLSTGGKWDEHIDTLQTIAETANSTVGIAEVAFHPAEAESAGIPVDHDDSHARAGNHRFALLLHAQQPADSDAAEAIKKMKKENVPFSYPSKPK